MRGWLSLVTIAAWGVALGCGGLTTTSSDGLPSSCAKSGAAPLTSACASCLAGACGGVYSAAASACNGLWSCQCACTNAACAIACPASPACSSAFEDLASCESPCATACAGSMVPPEDAGTLTPDAAGACDALTTCCMGLAPSEQAGCTTIANAGVAGDCRGALTGYEQNGMCK